MVAAFALASCSTANDAPDIQGETDVSEVSIKLPVIPEGTKADRILVDKSDRLLILFKGDEEIARYSKIRFGDAPEGHKRWFLTKTL